MGLWSDITDAVGDAFDSVGDWIEDGLDYLEENINNFLDDPWEATKDIHKDAFRALTGQTYLQNAMPDLPRPNPVYQDRKNTFRDSLAARQIVYGEVKKGGTIVYVETSGDDDEFLHLVIVLAGHSCKSIDEVYFGDTLAATKDSNGVNDSQTFVIEPDYTGKLTAYAQLGAHTAAYSAITSDAPDNWTSDHVLTGCCYLYLKFQYDKELFRRGIPEITVVMQGKDDLYDPRTTLTGYSENHAVICLDYLTSPLGLNVPSSEVDMQSFIDAAYFADGIVSTYSGGAAESRYSCSGVLSVDRRPIEHLEELQKAGAAFITRSQNVWRYVRAEYSAPILSLDENDLVGGVEFIPASAKEGRINSVKGVYISPDNDWQASEYPAVTIDSFVTGDLEELTSELDFNFVNSPYQAQRLAQIAINRSRYGLTVSGTFKFKALKVTPGQRVTLSIAPLGISNETFLVIDVGLSMSGGITLLLRQDAAAIYSDDPSSRAAITAPPAISLPDSTPIAPTSLSVVEELYKGNMVTNIKARAKLSWVDDSIKNELYKVQYKVSTDSDWIEHDSSITQKSTNIDDMTPETYDFRVAAINGVSRTSSWVTQTNVPIGGQQVPPQAVAKLNYLDKRLTWDYPNPADDFAGFEIRIVTDVDSWDDAAPLSGGYLTTTQLYLGYEPSDGDVFYIKAKDFSGNESSATRLQVEIAAPPLNPVSQAISISSIGAQAYTKPDGQGVTQSYDQFLLTTFKPVGTEGGVYPRTFAASRGGPTVRTPNTISLANGGIGSITISNLYLHYTASNGSYFLYGQFTGDTEYLVSATDFKYTINGRDYPASSQYGLPTFAVEITNATDISDLTTINGSATITISFTPQ